MGIALRAGVVLAFVVVGSADVAAQVARYGGVGEQHRYTRFQQDDVRQTVNGQAQDTQITSFWGFSAALRSNDNGVTVEVVHDSISIVAGSGSTGDYSGFYGKTVVLSMSPRGQVLAVTLPPDAPAETGRLDIRNTYQHFYPRLPGTELAPGTSWVDTLKIETTRNGIDIDIVTVRSYTVVGDAEREGRAALRVDYDASVAIEGAGVQNGAEIVLSGTGQGSGNVFLDPGSSLYLGGTESSTIRMDAFVTTGGQNLLIPIEQQRTETVRMVE